MQETLRDIINNAREIDTIVQEPYIYAFTESPKIKRQKLTIDEEFRLLDLSCRVVDGVRELLERRHRNGGEEASTPQTAQSAQ